MVIKLFLPIIILAAFLRLWMLNSLPPSLNWDEISIGYNAFSILKTGSDEWGQFLPLSFRAYGDYKLPMLVYLDIPFISIGLNEWGVRLPSAILGVGFVGLIFLILKNLANIRIALWGASITAVLPWAIVLSRVALEAHLALFLTTLGFYLFLVGLKNKKILILSTICFGLTIFSYNSSRIVTPLFIGALGVIYFKDLEKNKKFAILGLILFLAFFTVATPLALLQDSSARYRWTAILDEGAILKINELRGTSALPPTLERLSYNKATYFIPVAIKSYFSHFDPRFLFFSGGSHYQFSVPGWGLLYSFMIPFLMLGFWQILRERKKWQVLVLIWLIIAPIPAAITRDSPHALRSLIMLPPLIFLIALGFDQFVTLFKKKSILIGGLILVLFLNLFYFWESYSGDYRKNYSWAWQYGYKEAADYIKTHGESYSKVYFTKKYGEPHEFLLFYLKVDPEKYKNDSNLVRYQMSDWYWVDSFDKFIFVNDWEVKENVKCQMSNVKCLLITSPENYPENSKLLESINFLDGQKAFDIVELPQVQ